MTCWTSVLIQFDRAYTNGHMLLTALGKNEKSVMNQAERGGYARAFANNKKNNSAISIDMISSHLHMTHRNLLGNTVAG